MTAARAHQEAPNAQGCTCGRGQRRVTPGSVAGWQGGLISGGRWAQAALGVAALGYAAASPSGHPRMRRAGRHGSLLTAARPRQQQRARGSSCAGRTGCRAARARSAAACSRDSIAAAARAPLKHTQHVIHQTCSLRSSARSRKRPIRSRRPSRRAPGQGAAGLLDDRTYAQGGRGPHSCDGGRAGRAGAGARGGCYAVSAAGSSGAGTDCFRPDHPRVRRAGRRGSLLPARIPQPPRRRAALLGPCRAALRGGCRSGRCDARRSIL